MKLGVLYPRSNAHPGLLADFVDGIKTALQHQQLNLKIHLISESIGFGGIEKEVYEKAEKLLVLERADMLVAFVDLRILEILKPLFYASGKLILVVNPGANYPENWIPQPNILCLTLLHSFLCRLSGKQAAQLNKSSGAMATTFYDCGYLHNAAMVSGFVKGGGQITHNYVNNQPYNDSFDIRPLTEYLFSDKTTNSLLCIFDALPASLFYTRLNEYEGADSLHLFVSPMMMDQHALKHLGEGFKFSIDGYLPWHSSVVNNANKEFMESYLRQTKREATTFSLLGWETSLIIEQVFLNRNENYLDGAEIAGNLVGRKINSPRGEMNLDPATNYFIAPVYKCSIPKNSETLSLDAIENQENEWASFVEIPNEGVSSGWTNTYLCY